MYPLPPQSLPQMLSVDKVIPVIQGIIADREAIRESVVSKVTPETATFGNVIQPWLDEENMNQGAETLIDMYRYAGPNKAIRDAAEEATRLMSESHAKLMRRHDLYLLVKAVADRDDSPNEECRKAVKDMLREYTNVGYGKLSSQQIERLLNARQTISQLCQEFNQNLREKTKGLWFTPDELDGVPVQEIEHRMPVGRNEVYIDLGNRADRLLVQRFAHSSATRKRLYLENEQKLWENVPLFKKVLVVRDENARLLGYKSHAEFKLQDRVAASPESVDEMLGAMRQKVLPLGKRAMEKLKTIKKTHLGSHLPPEEDEILPWDYFYYMRLLEEETQVDHEVVAEYFPLQNTVLKMLGLFASFLQLKFVPIPPEALTGSTWHEDVKGWSVWDERPEHKGEFIGYLFSDILYRDGKYKGNQNVNLQASYIKPDGSRVLPATILMCNFSPSAVTGCALLKHSEVVTLFHAFSELGHGIHDLLSRTLHTRYHAWRVPVEFGEALSTMLENWCWDKTTLHAMSCHYTTTGPEFPNQWKAQNPQASPPAERISDKLLDRLIGERNLNRALQILKQTADSIFDMTIHNPASHYELVQLDETELYNVLYEELTLRRNPEPSTWGPAHCHFGHLMSGYDAGYFAYLSAQVFAADFYETAFAANPSCQNTWDRYRRVILEAGGSRDESKIMEEFLGHLPTPNALVRSLGLQ
ncbi:uncharacterized protein JN550_007059 [Neoarthrinium moseri]|uniref:uncharacterized protein n=1 Tax=Neoarthrinium moseri TaxID=1658444 RepID=UPI001FDBD7DE|nr:uncharacterized protein JN550_007059 [Neoarthrinium moseri]KAI1867328.1 hypothetical protein JN550_007059 [Neoarthrinium moseri]